MCEDWDIEQNYVAANHHEASGSIERSSRTL